jgi:hypothetical protein
VRHKPLPSPRPQQGPSDNAPRRPPTHRADAGG